MNPTSPVGDAEPADGKPHIIRIRGPWQRTVISDGAQSDTSTESSAGKAASTVKMPGSWLGDLGENFRGTVCYQRMFNRPTGITESTSLQLVFQQIVGDAEVRLNDLLLGRIEWPIQSGSFDVTNALVARNQIRVEIHALVPERAEAGKALPPGGMVGEVQLQIR